jgi:hypothetical protein
MRGGFSEQPFQRTHQKSPSETQSRRGYGDALNLRSLMAISHRLKNNEANRQSINLSANEVSGIRATPTSLMFL